MTIHNTTRKGIVLLLLAALKRHPAQLDPAPGRGYIAAMPPRRSSKKDSPAKLAGRMKRRWRVVLLRSNGEILGQVEAADAEAAEAPAAVQFDLDEVQRNRIMVQELG